MLSINVLYKNPFTGSVARNVFFKKHLIMPIKCIGRLVIFWFCPYKVWYDVFILKLSDTQIFMLPMTNTFFTFYSEIYEAKIPYIEVNIFVIIPLSHSCFCIFYLMSYT